MVKGRPLMSNCEPSSVGIEIMFLPVTVTDDGDLRAAAGRFLLRQERASMHGRHAEHREIIRADRGGEGAARIAFLAEADQREIVSHRVGEDGVLLADVAISRIRKSAKCFRVLLVLRKDLHHFVRLRVTRRRK